MNNLKRWNIFLLLVAMLAGSSVALATETRTSNTTQGPAAEAAAERSISQEQYGALVIDGERNKSARSAEQLEAMAVAPPPPPNTDFWIYDAWVDLYADVDRDGFYSGIELTFDADTIYGVADVYAVVYLSYELGPWNEYAVTEDFTIFGTSGNDEYVIESDLVSGYPTGEYDILIELFDAFDNSFVASIGPDEMPDLAILPLEDMNRDAVTETRITVNSGGGGSFSWLLLLGLAVAAVRRRQYAAHGGPCA